MVQPWSISLLLLFSAATARHMGDCTNGIKCTNITTTNNQTFQCRTAGTKNNNQKNILFLHGFPEFSAMYSDLMRTFAGLNYSAIACNQRGYSLHSPSSENDYLYTTLASDALNVARKHFGDTKFHLVGHDHGAFLGWVIAAANTNHLLLSYTALSVPHADAFANAVYGKDADIEQQIASQYFTMFIEKDSASSHLEFWWLSAGKDAGSKNAANIWTSSKDFQKAMWWYSGALNSGYMAIPPIMSASDILKQGVTIGHTGMAALRTLWGGTPNNGTAQLTPIGNVVGVPTLFVCGSQDQSLLCNRPYSLATKEYVRNATYEYLLVDCGHDLLQCEKQSETAKVVAGIVKHIQDVDDGALVLKSNYNCPSTTLINPIGDFTCPVNCNCILNYTFSGAIVHHVQIKIEVGATADINFVSRAGTVQRQSWSIQSAGNTNVNCLSMGSCAWFRFLGEGVSVNCQGNYS